MYKVLLVVRGIPSERDPMWGNFELDQAMALKNAGVKVACISIDRRIRFYKRKIGFTKETVSGIAMYNYFFPLPYRILPRVIHNFLVDYFFKRLYQRVVREEGRFDIIHAHYLPNIRLAIKAKSIGKVSVVGTEHWSELKRGSIKSSVKKDGMEAYPKVDSLITVSKALQKVIADKFAVRSNFIGCVVDDVFDYVPKEDDGIFRFIAVGSLFPIKGFDVAIRAFAKAGFDKNVQFIIIGDGYKRGELQKAVIDLGLQKQIHLVGRKTREEIMHYMKRSDAYVLSSRSENFATACMEAISAGLPSIVTKCGGPEDLVSDKNSILVTVDDVEEMASAMRYIMKNIGAYNRKEVSDSIRENYSSSAIADELLEVYQSINN